MVHGPDEVPLARPIPRWAPLIILASALLGFAGWAARGIVTDPGFTFLSPRNGAQWIAPPRTTFLIAKGRIPLEMSYLTQFNVETAMQPGPLYFSAFRSARVYVDGVQVYEESPNPRKWKHDRVVATSVLGPGRHTLEIRCYNEFGPPALRAYWPTVGLRTGTDWYWLDDTRTAYPVELASYVEPASVALYFPTVGESWRKVYPFVLIAIAFGAVVSLAGPTTPMTRAMDLLTPSRLRWLLILGTLGIGVHNVLRHVPTVGADVGDHIFYSRYIAEHARLPLADDGLQTFQAPLFYIVGAVFLKVVEFIGMERAAADQALRIIPLLCAVGLVQVGYGFLVRAFPESPASQRLGLCLAAAFPMAIYKAPVVNNEMPAALVSAWAALLVLDLFLPSNRRSLWRFVMAGTVWGLAVLTKVSALILAAPFLLGLAGLWYASKGQTKSLLSKTAAFFVSFAAVCGWYFARNYWHFGKMVIGGWDPLIGVEWWNFSGFRTPASYLLFGQALHRPLFCMVYGVWDGLYAGLWFDAEHSGVVTRGGGPEWNYPFATAVLPWAMPATFALLVGLVRAFLPSRTRELPGKSLVPLYCALVTGVYVASILGHTLVVPFYNSIKSTYALGAIPAIVVLIVAGASPLLRSRVGRAAVSVWLSVWLLLIGVGYWASSAP